MSTDTASTNPMLAAALSYARAGWPVVRLDDALAPIGDDATTEHDAIVNWWAQSPIANVGVALGIPARKKRGLCALVVEQRPVTDPWTQRHDVNQRIGAGHIFVGGSVAQVVWLFVTTKPLASRPLGDGVALLGQGVVAMPPSWSSGAERRWRKGRHDPERAVPPLPQWLDDMPAWEPNVAAAPNVTISDDWQRELILTEKGGPKSSLANIATVLRCADPFAGRIAYNEMRLAPTLDGVVIADEHVARIRERIEREFQFNPNDANTRAALLSIATERRFHPVREYLTTLQWDGTKRIDHVGDRILHVDPAPLTVRTLRAWFISVVARVMEPGCKVDTALVLVGPQSYLKSMFFRRLAGEWFSDTLMDIRNKDSLMQLADAWIYEWAEIENITGKREASEVKMFMSAQLDAFRPPFEHSVRRIPRTCVLVGTTNRDRFLNDESGSRRFWVLRIPHVIDIDQTVAWRDQLWAEAVVAYRARERWWLSREDDAERESIAEEFREEDPWTPLVREWLRANERENYTTAEILSGAITMHADAMDHRARGRLSAIMGELGLRSDKPRIIRAGRRLGPTRAWVWKAEFSSRPPAWMDDPVDDGTPPQSAGQIPLPHFDDE